MANAKSVWTYLARKWERSEDGRIIIRLNPKFGPIRCASVAESLMTLYYHDVISKSVRQDMADQFAELFASPDPSMTVEDRAIACMLMAEQS